jgi:hypothetical protein
MPERPTNMALAALSTLMRRQLLFVVVIFAAFIGFVTLAGDWSWSMVALAIAAAAMLALFGALVWFWITVFSRTGYRNP